MKITHITSSELRLVNQIKQLQYEALEATSDSARQMFLEIAIEKTSQLEECVQKIAGEPVAIAEES